MDVVPPPPSISTDRLEISEVEDRRREDLRMPRTEEELLLLLRFSELPRRVSRYIELRKVLDVVLIGCGGTGGEAVFILLFCGVIMIVGAEGSRVIVLSFHL